MHKTGMIVQLVVPNKPCRRFSLYFLNLGIIVNNVAFLDHWYMDTMFQRLIKMKLTHAGKFGISKIIYLLTLNFFCIFSIKHKTAIHS